MQTPVQQTPPPLPLSPSEKFLLFQVALHPRQERNDGKLVPMWQLQEIIWFVESAGGMRHHRSPRTYQTWGANWSSPHVGDEIKIAREERVEGARLTDYTVWRHASNGFNDRIVDAYRGNGERMTLLYKELLFSNRFLENRRKVEEVCFGHCDYLTSETRFAFFAFDNQRLPDLSHHEKAEWHREFGIDWDSVLEKIKRS